MKSSRTPSAVWRFFDRITGDDNRTVAIVCKLCDKQYKYFGNTTNLRVHLLNKHPIQWELKDHGVLDDNITIITDEDTFQSETPTKSRKRRRRSSNADNNVEMLEIQTDIEQDDETSHLIKQMHGGSDEEWLNEDVFETVDPFTQPKRKRRMPFKGIKREVITPPRLSYEAPKRRIVTDPKHDACTSFGEFVGNKLRKLKNVQTQSNVQQLITTILWQAEYGVYDNIETIKKILLNTVQDMTTQEEETTAEESKEEIIADPNLTE